MRHVYREAPGKQAEYWPLCRSALAALLSSTHAAPVELSGWQSPDPCHQRAGPGVTQRRGSCCGTAGASTLPQSGHAEQACGKPHHAHSSSSRRHTVPAVDAPKRQQPASAAGPVSHRLRSSSLAASASSCRPGAAVNSNPATLQCCKQMCQPASHGDSRRSSAQRTCLQPHAGRGVAGHLVDAVQALLGHGGSRPKVVVVPCQGVEGGVRAPAGTLGEAVRL